MIRTLPRFALATLVACLSLWGLPRSADAQQSPEPRRIGVLRIVVLPGDILPQQFRQGLIEAGYSEGRVVVVDWRYADGDYARVPGLAADLVQRKVDVIVVDSTVGTRAAKHATSTIPIVMANVADPVGSGLVTNLAHPGGNVTGLSNMLAELSAKRLQFLKEALPRATRVAVLWNKETPYSPKVIEDLKAVAPGKRQSMRPLRLSAERTLRRCTSSRIPSSLPIERCLSSWRPRIS